MQYLFIPVQCSVIDELNTKHDVVHGAIHCASLQVEGVPGLQLLVHRAPTRGVHLATAASVVGEESCLIQSASILVHVDFSPLTMGIVASITECYQVDPGTGGGEHS